MLRLGDLPVGLLVEEKTDPSVKFVAKKEKDPRAFNGRGGGKTNGSSTAIAQWKTMNGGASRRTTGPRQTGHY